MHGIPLIDFLKVLLALLSFSVDGRLKRILCGFKISQLVDISLDPGVSSVNLRQCRGMCQLQALQFLLESLYPGTLCL